MSDWRIQRTGWAEWGGRLLFSVRSQLQSYLHLSHWALFFFFNNIVSLFKAAALDFTYFLLYFYFEKVTSAYLSFLGFWNRVSCSPGWFCTCSVAEDDLDFPLPPKWCLHAWPLFALFASIFSQLELKASLSHY